MRKFGIINITPDSFSDGGRVDEFNLHSLISKGISKGIKIFDIGAESTRPGANLISPAQEIERFQPYIPTLRNFSNSGEIQLSIDTRNLDLLQFLYEEEVKISFANNVSGFCPRMFEFVRSNFPLARYIFMHNLGIPADKSLTMNGSLDQVLNEIISWILSVITSCKDSFGESAASMLVADPGVGFGKNADQSFHIIRNLHTIQGSVNIPILIGHSRKSFLRNIFSLPDSEDKNLDKLTYYISTKYLQNADYIRVHYY